MAAKHLRSRPDQSGIYGVQANPNAVLLADEDEVARLKREADQELRLVLVGLASAVDKVVRIGDADVAKLGCHMQQQEMKIQTAAHRKARRVLILSEKRDIRNVIKYRARIDERPYQRNAFEAVFQQ